VSSGGTASGTVVGGGGTDAFLNVQSGGTSYAAVLRQDGFADVYGTGSANGTIVSAGGGLTVEYGGIANGILIAGGRADLAFGATLAASSTISFSGGGGVLEIDSLPLPVNTISGFAAGDTIYMTDLSYNTSDTVNVLSAGVVTISAGGASYKLSIAGAQVGETDFVLSAGPGDYGLDLTRSGTGAVAGVTAAARMRFLAPQAAAAADNGGLTGPDVLHAQTMVAAPRAAGAVTSAAEPGGLHQDLLRAALPAAMIAPPAHWLG
jgi:hypothetical protein